MKLLPLFLLLLLPAVGQAQLTFITNADNTITITGYSGTNSNVVIPSTITGLPVTRLGDFAFYAANVTNVLIPDSVANIGDGAFFDCQSLANVTLGRSVTNLGDWTFGFCPGLTSINCRGNAPNLGGGNVFYGNAATVYYLPDTIGWGPTFDGHTAVLWNSPPVPFSYTINSDGVSLTINGYTGTDAVVTIPSSINFLPVTSIGNSAFFYYYKTAMTSVMIPNSITSIGSNAFLYCSGVTNVTIGNSVTNIGSKAFGGCHGLTSVTLPISVTTIGNYAFLYCSGLTAITVAASNPAYSSVNGVLFDKNQTMLIQYPGGKAGSYSIPNSVTSIESAAFYYCSGLTDVTIGNSITNIGSEAFTFCSGLTAITVAASNPAYSSVNGVLFDKNQTMLIQYPGGKAGSYSIPNSVTSIESEAFYYCHGLTSVTIGNSVTNIGDWAFYSCSGLTDVTIPNSVTNIGSSAFTSCSGLTDVTIGNSVTSIGDRAFTSCGLTSVTIPNSVTSIGTDAFAFCFGLTNVTIGNSVTNIGSGAFAYCSGLTDVTIGNSVTSIGSESFVSCSGLTSVTIPNSVTSIGDLAFLACSGLTGIYFQGNAPGDGSNSFEFSMFANDYNVTIYYLPGTTGWNPIFDGVHTVLWNPQPQTSGVSFGVKSKRFGFNLTGNSGLVVVVEGSTNLRDWVPVQTNTLTGGTAYFSDPQWTNYPGRFYRLRSP